MNWTISVILICIILAIFSIWLEYRRNNHSRLAWRILAVLIAIGALACLALPITYQSKTQTTEGNNAAALLTDGYAADSIGSQFKYVFTTDKAIKKAYPKATLVSSLQEIDQHKPAVSHLHILGYGLSKNELKPLKNVRVAYIAPKAPAGLQAINWPAHLKAGEQLKVQGQFSNTTSNNVKLVLKGLSTGLDSLNIAAGKTVDFELTAQPKATGRLTYELTALSGTDTLTHETLPVIIEPTKPLKVLMLSASPNFETNFLKNWLSGNGYAVAARAVISKDKISQDFVNVAKLPLERLTPALLAQFDAVIGDLSALKALSPPESSALKQQVSQNGLGVIVRADSSDKNVTWLERDFPVNTVPAKAQLSTILQLQNQAAKTAALSIDPSYLTPRSNTQNLVVDAQNHIVASSALAGAGRVVFTTLNHTYTWMLGGDGKDYSLLWSLLIGKAVKKAPPVANWQVISAMPTVNQAVQIQYQGVNAPTPLTVNQTAVAPVQNPDLPFIWHVTYWPKKSGWQKANAGNGSLAFWYNYAEKGWSSLKTLKKIADTKNYVENQAKVNSVTKQIQQKVSIEVPKIYFYLLLLASCTFLWAERKLTT